jgi:hypothetical protein
MRRDRGACIRGDLLGAFCLTVALCVGGALAAVGVFVRISGRYQVPSREAAVIGLWPERSVRCVPFQYQGDDSREFRGRV